MMSMSKEPRHCRNAAVFDCLDSRQTYAAQVNEIV